MAMPNPSEWYIRMSWTGISWDGTACTYASVPIHQMIYHIIVLYITTIIITRNYIAGRRDTLPLWHDYWTGFSSALPLLHKPITHYIYNTILYYSITLPTIWIAKTNYYTHITDFFFFTALLLLFYFLQLTASENKQGNA